MSLCDAGPSRYPPKTIETITVDLDANPRSAQLTAYEGVGLTAEQSERLQMIHARMIEARRELDALIGDAYLRPRANIVPVHFLDLASAVEKLRWAEKEWRELDKEIAAAAEPAETTL